MDDCSRPPAERVGIVAELWRFPVKSMGGERLEEASITSQGVLGDRGFALLDEETNEVISASNRHFPGLLNWRATFVEPPQADTALPPVRITLPDGRSGTSDSPAFLALLSSHFGRSVALIRTLPESYVKRQSAFFAGIGLECTSPSEPFVDLCPVSVITAGTLARLNVDPRRFRMNVTVSTTGHGFVENAWPGCELSLGSDVRLAITIPDPRCVMATLPQGDLPRDPGVLRTVSEMNTLPVGRGGPLPCAGVYASVAHPGHVRSGDPVLITRR